MGKQRSYRILVLEGQAPRPVKGMRVAGSAEEREVILSGLRAMCPEERYTYETLRPAALNLQPEA